MFTPSLAQNPSSYLKTVENLNSVKQAVNIPYSLQPECFYLSTVEKN